MKYKDSLAFAQKLDDEDSLKDFREKFFIPENGGKELVYFCGNSLGLQPKSVEKYIKDELSDWASLAVEGHVAAKKPWVTYHKFLQPYLAELVGAKVEEVVPANSLTVNLHLLLTSFYKPIGKRRKILVEHNAFSSDLYALQSQAILHGFNPKDVIIEVQPDHPSGYISVEKFKSDIIQLKDQIALVLIGGVNYLTGQAFDIESITAHAHNYGIAVGVDLAHAIGNIPLSLNEWGVDFAVWCSYKYLNSGPGGTGGYFIHESHAKNKKIPRMAGWWGHNEEKRFQMPRDFDPIPTAEGWQLSNAPVLSLAAQSASLQIFKEAGIERLRGKSILLTGFLEFLLKEKFKESNPFEIEIITCEYYKERGCQLSLRVKKNASLLLKKIKEAGFIIDFRNPDIIRVSPVPLYNRFAEVFQFADFLGEQVNE